MVEVDVVVAAAVEAVCRSSSSSKPRKHPGKTELTRRKSSKALLSTRQFPTQSAGSWLNLAIFAGAFVEDLGFIRLVFNCHMSLGWLRLLGIGL